MNGRPTLMCPCEGVPRNNWVRLTLAVVPKHVFLEWFVRWEVSKRAAAVLKCATSSIRSKQFSTFIYSFHIVFFSLLLLRNQVVQLYSNSYMVIAWKNSSFILWKISDFPMVVTPVRSSPLFTSTYADVIRIDTSHSISIKIIKGFS